MYINILLGMATNTVNIILPPEDYGDVYVDPVDIFETNIDDKKQRADFEEDDDYDWIELEESNCKEKKDEKECQFKRNIEVGIVAGVIVVVIVLTVVITRAILQPTCKDGWIELSTKSCFKFFPTACEEGCSFDRAQEICRLKGGLLAEPRAIGTFKEIIAIASDSKKLSHRNFWLGLEFDIRNQHFQWISDHQEANLPDNLWSKGHPNYDGSHVHLKKGDMLLADVSEGEAYKPVCQRKKGVDGCTQGWQNPGSNSLYCYNFMENECEGGCDWDDAGEVCEDNHSYLAEGPDFEFLTKFARIIAKPELRVNWRLGITYNKTEDKFIQESDGAEVDLPSSYKKQTASTSHDEGKPWFYPDIEFKYEYDYHEELHDMFDFPHVNTEDGRDEVTCMELTADAGWQLREGRCQKRKSKENNIQPLCQL